MRSGVNFNCYHCRNNSECRDCGGTGRGKKTGEAPRHTDRYEIDGVGFSYKNLYRLFLLSKNENAPAIWRVRSPSKINIFEVKKIEVALMHMYGRFLNSRLTDALREGEA